MVPTAIGQPPAVADEYQSIFRHLSRQQNRICSWHSLIWSCAEATSAEVILCNTCYRIRQVLSLVLQASRDRSGFCVPVFGPPKFPTWHESQRPGLVTFPTGYQGPTCICQSKKSLRHFTRHGNSIDTTLMAAAVDKPQNTNISTIYSGLV